MTRTGTIVLRALGATAAVALVVVVVWMIDTSRHQSRANRNVEVAGRGVGGMRRAQLAEVVRELAARYRSAPVHVDAPGGGFVTSPAEIGLTVEENATVQALLDAGDGRGPLGWLRSFVVPSRARVQVSVDTAAVWRVVAARDKRRVPPVEPSIRADKTKLVAVAGRPGRGIDPARLIAALPDAAGEGIPITVEMRRGPVPPRFTMADAARLARQAEALASRSITVTADDDQAAVGVAQLRSWLRSQPTDTGLRVAVDAEKAAAELGNLLPGAGTPPVETRFDVVDGAVRIVPGQDGTACCSPAAGGRIEQALRQGQRDPVQVPLKRVEPQLSTDEAAALGIREPVASFSTDHRPRQARVANIHRIADMVRGQVVKPGTTFSVNSFVGRRTVEKGFVVAPVIEEGRFTDDVGGGISQFATTLFNAAFFAGLEFPEYQSHSIYIPRYPYGREATLSYPHPDLKLRNPTPFGVLIWPTYSDSRITVTLFSTKWADVAQTNQTTQPRGPCTRVRTERTRRVLADGAVKVDHVSALYRPEEGVKCS